MNKCDIKYSMSVSENAKCLKLPKVWEGIIFLPDIIQFKLKYRREGQQTPIIITSQHYVCTVYCVLCVCSTYITCEEEEAPAPVESAATQ